MVESNLNVETEARICVAQEQALQTNYLKHYIDKTTESTMCVTCRKEEESLQQVIKLLWDVNIQCDNVRDQNTCSCVREYKKKHSGMIIDVAIPAAARLHDKEIRKKVKKMLAFVVQDCQLLGNEKSSGDLYCDWCRECEKRFGKIGSQIRHSSNCSVNVENYSIRKIRIVKESTVDSKNYVKLLITKQQGGSLRTLAICYGMPNRLNIEGNTSQKKA